MKKNSITNVLTHLLLFKIDAALNDPNVCDEVLVNIVQILSLFLCKYGFNMNNNYILLLLLFYLTFTLFSNEMIAGKACEVFGAISYSLLMGLVFCPYYDTYRLLDLKNFTEYSTVALRITSDKLHRGHISAITSNCGSSLKRISQIRGIIIENISRLQTAPFLLMNCSTFYFHALLGVLYIYFNTYLSEEIKFIGEFFSLFFRAFLSQGFASVLFSHLPFGRRCGIILDASKAFGTQVLNCFRSFLAHRCLLTLTGHADKHWKGEAMPNFLSLRLLSLHSKNQPAMLKNLCYMNFLYFLY
uniref:ABC transmembrane type-1 domain-containing protein n=1 Tax=Heterorhabditis bacteriophora TaxID=37862 RepID=A0A1I7X3N8_HETBA